VIYEESYPEQISPELLDQVALWNDSAEEGEEMHVCYEDEYLTLYIGTDMITQGESEVNERVRQINRENGNFW
jgi:hypothetical protein